MITPAGIVVLIAFLVFCGVAYLKVHGARVREAENEGRELPAWPRPIEIAKHFGMTAAFIAFVGAICCACLLTVALLDWTVRNPGTAFDNIAAALKMIDQHPLANAIAWAFVVVMLLWFAVLKIQTNRLINKKRRNRVSE